MNVASAVRTRAEEWFSDDREFRQLCGDAQSQSRDESSQEFAAQMMIAANRYGLKTYVSTKQLLWLCRLADWDVPPRLGGVSLPAAAQGERR